MGIAVIFHFHATLVSAVKNVQFNGVNEVRSVSVLQGHESRREFVSFFTQTDA